MLGHRMQVPLVGDEKLTETDWPSRDQQRYGPDSAAWLVWDMDYVPVPAALAVALAYALRTMATELGPGDASIQARLRRFDDTVGQARIPACYRRGPSLLSTG